MIRRIARLSGDRLALAHLPDIQLRTAIPIA